MIAEKRLQYGINSVKIRLPAPNKMENAFSTENFLYNVDLSNLKDVDLLVLDRLCKKIEVVKALYCFYSGDLSKSLDKDIIVNDDYIVYLCGIYLFLWQNQKDYKFLNTSLKLLDGLLCQPEKFPAEFYDIIKPLADGDIKKCR